MLLVKFFIQSVFVDENEKNLSMYNSDHTAT